MGKKKVYEIECDCGMMIKGFSEHHAKQNRIIHKKASWKHKELLNQESALKIWAAKGLRFSNIKLS